MAEIFKKGYSYKKAGVIITEIVPDAPIQADLFDTVDRDRQKRLMKAIYSLNDGYGTNKVRSARFGIFF